MDVDRDAKLLRAEHERWSRIEAAKTPEELADALRPAARGRRPLATFARWFAATVVAVVWVAVWVSALVLPSGRPRDVEAATVARTPTFTAPPARPRRPVVNVMPLDGAEAGVAIQVNPDGSPAYDPEWRRDGNALLLMTLRGAAEIRRSADSWPEWRRMRLVSRDLAVSPSYGPDGRRLAYMDLRSRVHVGAVSSGKFRTLTLPIRQPSDFDWSADDRLAIVGGRNVYIVRPNGTVLREIVMPYDVGFPAWSPDGSDLLVTQLRPTVTLVVVSPETGAWRRLLRTRAPSGWGSWSPDAKSVAFTKFVDGTWDLFVVEQASGRERRLTSGLGAEVSPAWSPDGRWLAYVTQET